MIGRVEAELARLRALRWTGPDRNERVEQFLRERLHMENRKHRSKATTALLLAAVFGGGAVAGGVTHHFVTRSVTIVVSETEAMELEGVPDGAQFIPPNFYIDENGDMHTTGMSYVDENGQEQVEDLYFIDVIESEGE
ncbi:MAG TPA: hypothetical protein VFF69_06860 [Phycisphaerales bacterium]|nr:hypothetical protein [Phycisphaerales bacterium]